MTREEFFYKYGCECKDPNCSSVVKEKCSAEFYRDLDFVIKSNMQQSDIKGLVDGLIEEMEKLGADFTSTNMEFYRNGAKYILVMGLNYAGEERMQQDE